MISAKIDITGNVGKDIEQPKTAKNGTKFVSVDVAVKTNFKLPNGEYLTNWYKCVIWGREAERAAATWQKGTTVHVIGDLTLRPWTTKTGETRVEYHIEANDAEGLTKLKGRDNAAATVAPTSTSISDGPDWLNG